MTHMSTISLAADHRIQAILSQLASVNLEGNPCQTIPSQAGRNPHPVSPFSLRLNSIRPVFKKRQSHRENGAARGDGDRTPRKPARDLSGQWVLFDNEEEEMHTTHADIVRVTDTSIRDHHRHHHLDNMNNTTVHWAWSEVEDPTVQAALKLGLHPKHVATGKQKQHSRNGVAWRPERVLQQVLRQNCPGCYFRMNCTNVMRPTETSKRKRRFQKTRCMRKEERRSPPGL